MMKADLKVRFYEVHLYGVRQGPPLRCDLTNRPDDAIEVVVTQ